MSRGNPKNLKPFEKGHTKVGGRKLGVPNRLTRSVNEAVLLAAEAVGFDNRGTDGLVGYLERIAIKDSKGFAVLLARRMALEGPAPVPHSLDLSKLSDEELRQLEHIIMKAQIPITIVEHAITEIAPVADSGEKPNEGFAAEIMDAQRAIETLGAELAAGNATAADIAKLRRLLREAKEVIGDLVARRK